MLTNTWRPHLSRGIWARNIGLTIPGKGLRVMSGMSTPRPPKEEGSISSIFSSLSGEALIPFPARFSVLKKDIWRDDMIQSWKQVLEELEVAVEEVSHRGNEMVPKISYKDIQNGLSDAQIANIRKTGTVIVTGGIPQEEALQWKQSIRDYATANQKHVRGFPSDNIQVFELYNSNPQVQARTHPAVIETQKFLLSLWHTSDPLTEISLSTPISYFDRLRIRQPGDSKFTLGPHVDGGSVERWEDPAYRTCFEKILRGGASWKEHDPFDATPRINAKQDLYHASNQCSIFRPWQGWTSMSSSGPNEGTLRVLPFLSLSSAYIMLRPFFRPRFAQSTSLKFEDWEVDITGTTFPGSGFGKAQELNEMSHPHLKLDKTMVSIPRVEPGDQVYWHCDVVHAVEAQHHGPSDSSVMYIPAVPLTLNNASYLRDQRMNFNLGLPAPDFPGGEGESKFVGRATVDDIKTPEGRCMFGFEKFKNDSNADFINKVNKVLAE